MMMQGDGVGRIDLADLLRFKIDLSTMFRWSCHFDMITPFFFDSSNLFCWQYNFFGMMNPLLP